VKTVTAFALAAVLIPSIALGDSGTVTMREAITLSLERNHLLKSAAYEQTAARSDVAVSRSYYLPRVSVEEAFSASNSPTQAFMMKLGQGRFVQSDFDPPVLNHPPARDNFRTAFTVEQTLYDRSIGIGLDLSRAEERSRGLTLERSREEVAFQVFSVCLAVRTAHAYLANAEQAVKDAREHLRLATVRNEAEVGLKSDELRARTFFAEMEEGRISAENNLTLARMRLALLTGGAAGDQLDISGDPAAFAPPAGEGELVQTALQARHDLQGVSVAVEKADLGVKMANSAWWPRAFATASYELNARDLPFTNDNDAWMVGAGLRWELFDGLRRIDRKDSASALRNAAAEQLERYKKEVSFEVIESMLRRDEAAKRLAVAQGAVSQAEEGVRLIGKRFENSISPMVELIDAQNALNRARANLIDGESNYALANGNVYHAAGTFLKEVLK
jgi:outer membrane protein